MQLVRSIFRQVKLLNIRLLSEYIYNYILLYLSGEAYYPDIEPLHP